MVEDEDDEADRSNDAGDVAASVVARHTDGQSRHYVYLPSSGDPSAAAGDTFRPASSFGATPRRLGEPTYPLPPTSRFPLGAAGFKTLGK